MLTKSLAVDGEYCLLIGGSTAPIYCHGMQTSDPKEYVAWGEYCLQRRVWLTTIAFSLIPPFAICFVNRKH